MVKMRIPGTNIRFLEQKTVYNPDEIIGKTSGFVLANEPFSVIIHAMPQPRQVNPMTMWDYFRRNPEVNAVITAIVEDILSDGWRYEIDSETSGKTKKKRAEEFFEENHAKEVFKSVVFDMLVTGNGYIYKAKFSDVQIDLAYKTACAETGIEYKSKFSSFVKRKYKSILEEEQVTKRKFVDIPSSTITCQYDKNGNILKYVQKVPSQAMPIFFESDEVINIPFMKLDGKIYGYTPLASLVTIMDTLQDMRDYLRYFWNQGGVPNFLFMFKGESPGSPNVKSFDRKLRDYTSIINKYKSLVGTTGEGGVQIERLAPDSKDMEFRELATYLTRVIVMTFGVPSKRLSDLLIVKGARTGQTDEGYYRKISHMQDILEYYINTYLLDGFGVKMKFNRTYKQDEVREAQTDLTKTNVAQMRMNLGIWSKEKAAIYLGIPVEDIPKMPENPSGPAPQQFPLPNSKLMPETDKIAADQQRENTQKENVELNPPTP